MDKQLSSKTLDHLGLVSGMIDELDLVNTIDELVPQDFENRNLSIGTICKALIINGLGFTQRTIYMVSSFFEGKPVEKLLGEGITSNQLNESAIGRSLDALYDYGVTALYSKIAPSVCNRLGLGISQMHMDITSFSVQGEYNSESPPSEGEKTIWVTNGYSRDHRPDLCQVVLNMVCENKAGIPLRMEALSGNTNDKEAFRNTVEALSGEIRAGLDSGLMVMDSAGYTSKMIALCGDGIKWISRVPSTIKECRGLLQAGNDSFSPLTDGYLYYPVNSSYGGTDQRWLVIFSKAAYQREAETLRKKFLKKGAEESARFERLCRTPFACAPDAEAALAKFQKTCSFITVSQPVITENKKFSKPGRPPEGAEPDKSEFFIEGRVSSCIETFKKHLRTKGRFVIATNQCSEDILSDRDILMNYKGQSKIERGFRFIKDPQFVASSFFVKKPERLEALIFIMTLCLTVYASLEYKLRKSIEEREEPIPDQLGKDTMKPTARWVFQLFADIHVLSGMDKDVVLNIKEIHKKILCLLGFQFQKYYLLE